MLCVCERETVNVVRVCVRESEWWFSKVKSRMSYFLAILNLPEEQMYDCDGQYCAYIYTTNIFIFLSKPHYKNNVIKIR